VEFLRSNRANFGSPVTLIFLETLPRVHSAVSAERTCTKISEVRCQRISRITLPVWVSSQRSTPRHAHTRHEACERGDPYLREPILSARTPRSRQHTLQALDCCILSMALRYSYDSGAHRRGAVTALLLCEFLEESSVTDHRALPPLLGGLIECSKLRALCSDSRLQRKCRWCETGSMNIDDRRT